MDNPTKEIIRSLLTIIYLATLLVCIILRYSIFSIIYILILSVFPNVHTFKGRIFLYFFTLVVGLGIFACQLVINYYNMKNYQRDIDTNYQTQGCKSTSDMILFDQLGFAWFACDSIKKIIFKICIDLFVSLWCTILIIYNFSVPLTQPLKKPLLENWESFTRIKLTIVLIDAITCLLAVLTALFNPNVTSLVFFFAIVFYPLFKMMSNNDISQPHRHLSYKIISKYHLYIFYIAAVIYTCASYLNRFPLILEIIKINNKFFRVMKATLFSHMDELNGNSTSHLILVLNISMLCVSSLKIYLRHFKNGMIDKSKIIFYAHSVFFHIKFFVNQYSNILSTVCCFIWVIYFKNYLSFFIFFITLIPFLVHCGELFYFIQALTLEIVFFFCLILQYVSTISSSENYYVHKSYEAIFKIGLYSDGYAPFVLSLKYITFLSTLIFLSSIVKRKFMTFDVNRTMNYISCETCDNIRDETWLIHPNIIVQFFTYLLTVFSRPILCIYPLIELYYNRSNVHTCILIGLFMLLSVTQTKKKGWEVLQKSCLHVANYYLALWILCYYFVQIFGLSLGIDKIYPLDLIFELFDLKNDSRHFVITSLGWLIISLILHRFLLSYYSSVLISNRVVIASENNQFKWPRSFDLLSMLNFLLYVLYHNFLELNRFMVINRRLIVSIICFAVSLVRPSLLTFLSFIFSCYYATSYHKRLNAIIANILMVFSVIIVLIMVIYQNKYIPPLNLGQLIANCSNALNESSISTGLSKVDSFSPIIAFLCVVFIFSFLNSLSRYYDTPNKIKIRVSIDNFRSFVIHLSKYFITYFGYELIILTGVLAVVQHKDLGSIVSIALIIFIMLSCPNLYGYYQQNSGYFIKMLSVYKSCVFLLMIIRFSLHIFYTYLTCWITIKITDISKLNFLRQMFITRTVSTENKIQVIFDFIHLFIVRIYVRSLTKNKIAKLNILIPDIDFTSCSSFMHLIQHAFNSHFIQIVLAVVYFAGFHLKHLLNVSYLVCVACIIVFEQRMFFSRKFKVLLRILNFLPIILILIKLLTQMLYCLDPPLFLSNDIFLKFLLGIQCPDKDIINIYNSYHDILVLLVLLVQNRIYITRSFNYTIINYYLYHLEAVNISTIVTSEAEIYRSDYENKIKMKHEKIKKSIVAIKRNIEVDCGIPTRQSKIDSLYGVDQAVFDKFYSHRDGQNQIFDDYNHRDVDDYIMDLNQPQISVNASNKKKDLEIQSEVQRSTFSDRLNKIKQFCRIFINLFSTVMKKIQKINKKDRDRREKILAVIEDGKRIHFDEIKNLVRSIAPYFEYRYEKEITKNSHSSFVEPSNKLLVFIVNMFEILMHILIRNTDFMVFIAMVINQIYSSSIMSLIIILSYLLYAAIVVPRPSPTYWRIISLIVLFSAFARYVCSIYPLSTCMTCSFSKCSSSSRRTTESVTCLVRSIGIDGCEYSFIPDLFLLLAIQIHIISLHYRGLLHHFSQNKFNEDRGSISFYSRIKEKFKDFMKIYETNICTLEPDNYIVIFVTQLGQWMIIAVFWNSFIGPTTVSGDITKIIKGSIIPVSFSILITFQSLFILFDRFINLNRMRSTKMVYTIFLVILIHIVIFYIVPNKTQDSVINNKPVCIFYILYCIYFYYSYIPVRNGYNITNVLPYTITKFHNYYSVGIIFFIIYFPFVYELDTALRWFSSNTSLGFFQYIKIDEIFFNMHICKSFRKISQENGDPAGKLYNYPIKLIVTLCSLIIFFFALLLPLWLYSTGITAIKSVLPSQIDFSISINGYSDLYFSSVVKSNFKMYKNFEDINEIVFQLPPSKQYYAKSVLIDYKEIGDIIYVEFSKPSYNSWTISPPTRLLLINDIKKNLTDIVFRLRFKLHRESSDLANVFGSEKIEGSFIISSDSIHSNISIFQKNLIDALRNTESHIYFKNFLPAAIRVEPAKPLSSFEGITNSNKSPVCAYHESQQNHQNSSNLNDWWTFITIEENDNSSNKIICGSPPHLDKAKKIGMYFFIDYLKSSYIDLFSPSKNAIALYIILITSFSTFLKKFFLNTSHLIMYQEIPNPDYILNLCRYIYRARWSGDIELEQFFVSILFFIYRSPETLIRTTRLHTETNS